MKLVKTLVAAVASVAFAAAAFASDFGPEPANYEDSATDYVLSRLVNTNGARVEFASDPYEIYADIAGYEAVPGWAVDVRVKSRLPGGSFGGFVPYTVVFIDGEPVALEEDDIKLSRL